MKLFLCGNCDNLVYFENSLCENCGKTLAFDAVPNMMVALDAPDPTLTAPETDGTLHRLCANFQNNICNWTVPAGDPNIYCLACRHNNMIPDLTIPSHLPMWRAMEAAKRHLFYSLLRLKLPLKTKSEDPEGGLSFDFLADDTTVPGSIVLTGHEDGKITLNLAEADDAVRELRRTQMHEPYRTLLGHFRHEIGHYYWHRLVRDGNRIDAFRAEFGDESQDYATALKNYYGTGAPPDWRDSFISTYATSHPWEDFAESWAHYFHIVDTLEMARAYGLSVSPIITNDSTHDAQIDFDPHTAEDIDQLILRWPPITMAINSINRCMGQPDLYPFILTQPVIRKLTFVHDLIEANRLSSPPR